MSDKPKFPRALALDVSRDFMALFDLAHCERLAFAGSLRRRKPMVGDLEVLFIPRIGEEIDPEDMFGGKRPANLAERAIAAALKNGTLRKRLNAQGREAWGEKIKLAVHTASGLPVDLFAATRENWSNYLVCRTGGAESNTAICIAAQERGWKWCPYSPGFVRGGETWESAAERRPVTSEREVFAVAGLPYLEPWERK